MDPVKLSKHLDAYEEGVAKAIRELRVSNGTPVKDLSNSILCYMDEGDRVCLSSIGANALSQAVKAVGAGQAESAQEGKLLYIVPTFDTKQMMDRDSGQYIELTALRLILGRIPLIG